MLSGRSVAPSLTRVIIIQSLNFFGQATKDLEDS